MNFVVLKFLEVFYTVIPDDGPNYVFVINWRFMY